LWAAQPIHSQRGDERDVRSQVAVPGQPSF